MLKTNPYVLPEGNVQISFSGGRTSAYMLHQLLEANGNLPDRCQISFQNTGREMPETLDFVQQCSIKWGVPVVWLEYERLNDKVTFCIVNHNSASRNGEPFEKLIKYKRVLPNTLMRFCTVELKINTAKRYLKSLGWKTWLNAVGIRADEPKRFNKPPKKDVWLPWRPLVDAGVTNQTVQQFWAQQSFDLNLESAQGNTIYGNCDGCFLKSESKLAMLLREHPDKYEWWVKLENAHSHRGSFGYFNNTRPMAKLKDNIERQGDWIFDQEDYFCQADGGECTG